MPKYLCLQRSVPTTGEGSQPSPAQMQESWLEGSYLWSAVLADLHRPGGDRAAAERHRSSALQAAPSDAVRTVLQRRLRSS